MLHHTETASFDHDTSLYLKNAAKPYTTPQLHFANGFTHYHEIARLLSLLLNDGSQ